MWLEGCVFSSSNCDTFRGQPAKTITSTCIFFYHSRGVCSAASWSSRICRPCLPMIHPATFTAGSTQNSTSTIFRTWHENMLQHPNIIKHRSHERNQSHMFLEQLPIVGCTLADWLMSITIQLWVSDAVELIQTTAASIPHVYLPLSSRPQHLRRNYKLGVGSGISCGKRFGHFPKDPRYM